MFSHRGPSLAAALSPHVARTVGVLEYRVQGAFLGANFFDGTNDDARYVNAAQAREERGRNKQPRGEDAEANQDAECQ